MTDAWDGRPQNPERDGWHWLMQDTLLYPARWDAAASAWHRSRFLTPHEITRLNDYCGPCLTPSETERLRAERDALRVECYAVGENYEIAKRGQLSAEAARDAARSKGIEAAAKVCAKFRSNLQNEADHVSTFQMEGALCAAISALDEAEVAIRALLTEGER